jgi:hypothetical protein
VAVSAPYEIEVTFVDDSRVPTKLARVVRDEHGAVVYRSQINGEFRAILGETNFDDYERAVACVDRWLRGTEWRW